MINTEQIAENLKQVQDTIAQACARAGREPAEVTLVAVSKTQPAEVVLGGIAAGLQHLGENRVEEASTKIPEVSRQAAGPVTWHMIGHIQSRKAKFIPPLFQMVHSLDSFKLATKLSQLANEQGMILNVLLEMNVSGEASKSGLAAANWSTDQGIREHLWGVVGQIFALPDLNVRGLMTMAPVVADAEQVRPLFASLAALRVALADTYGMALSELSMGMTDDYPVAIEEGATLVRIGRAIFGERQK